MQGSVLFQPSSPLGTNIPLERGESPCSLCNFLRDFFIQWWKYCLKMRVMLGIKTIEQMQKYANRNKCKMVQSE